MSTAISSDEPQAKRQKLAPVQSSLRADTASTTHVVPVRPSPAPVSQTLVGPYHAALAPSTYGTSRYVPAQPFSQAPHPQTGQPNANVKRAWPTAPGPVPYNAPNYGYQQMLVPPKTPFGILVGPAPPTYPPAGSTPAKPQHPLDQPQNVKISKTAVLGGAPKPKVIRNVDRVDKPSKDGKYRSYSFAQRIQALTLLTHKYNSAYIEWCTGVKPKAQTRILRTAQERGFDFIRSPLILDAYVVDGQRSGRPKGSRTKFRNGVPVEETERNKRRRAYKEKIRAQGSAKSRDSALDVDHDDEDEDDGEEHGNEGANEETRQNEHHNEDDAARHMQGIAAQLVGIQQYLHQSSSEVRR